MVNSFVTRLHRQAGSSFLRSGNRPTANEPRSTKQSGQFILQSQLVIRPPVHGHRTPAHGIVIRNSSFATMKPPTLKELAVMVTMKPSTLEEMPVMVSIKAFTLEEMACGRSRNLLHSKNCVAELPHSPTLEEIPSG